MVGQLSLSRRDPWTVDRNRGGACIISCSLSLHHIYSVFSWSLTDTQCVAPLAWETKDEYWTCDNLSSPEGKVFLCTKGKSVNTSRVLYPTPVTARTRSPLKWGLKPTDKEEENLTTSRLGVLKYDHSVVGPHREFPPLTQGWGRHDRESHTDPSVFGELYSLPKYNLNDLTSPIPSSPVPAGRDG